MTHTPKMQLMDARNGFIQMREIVKLLLSLSAGALVVISMFVREPPPVAGAKYHVLVALLSFLLALLAFLTCLVDLSIAELGVAVPDEKELKEALAHYRRFRRIGYWSFVVGIFAIVSLAQRVVVAWP